MAFRTIVVSSHSKLEYSLNYLVCKTIDDVKRINIDEIHTLIIESTSVSITSALMVELVKKKIKVLFCDEKRNPLCELSPFYGDSISPKRIQEQISWSEHVKALVWQRIVIEKIRNQAKTISIVDKSISNQLLDFSTQVIENDLTNREGHAAKVYFNNIYGPSFKRGNANLKNVFLNYGYSILLSQFNKCIVSKGYLTQLGIHHKNEFNQYNLSCDLMEPFRPIVDMKALHVDEENYKDEMIDILNLIVRINGENQTVYNAISIYCTSIFRALNTENVNEVVFVEYYEL